MAVPRRFRSPKSLWLRFLHSAFLQLFWTTGQAAANSGRINWYLHRGFRIVTTMHVHDWFCSTFCPDQLQRNNWRKAFKGWIIGYSGESWCSLAELLAGTLDSLTGLVKLRISQACTLWYLDRDRLDRERASQLYHASRSKHVQHFGVKLCVLLHVLLNLLAVFVWRWEIMVDNRWLTVVDTGW